MNGALLASGEAVAITFGDKVTRQAVRIIEKFNTDFFLSLGEKIQDFNGGLLQLLNAQAE